MARELTNDLKNESIDWQHKQSGRARMRSIVEKTFRKYDYPPQEVKEAWKLKLNNANTGQRGGYDSCNRYALVTVQHLSL